MTQALTLKLPPHSPCSPIPVAIDPQLIHNRALLKDPLDLLNSNILYGRKQNIKSTTGLCDMQVGTGRGMGAISQSLLRITDYPASLTAMRQLEDVLLPVYDLESAISKQLADVSRVEKPVNV